MKVKIATTTYKSDPMGRVPMAVSTSQFVLVDRDGTAIVREQSNGQSFFCEFKKLGNARTRAREIHTLGEDHPEVGVFDKRKEQVVFAAS